MMYYKQHQEGRLRLFSLMSEMWASRNGCRVDPFTLETKYQKTKKKFLVHYMLASGLALVCLCTMIIFVLVHGHDSAKVMGIAMTLEVIYGFGAIIGLRSNKRPKECYSYDSDICLLMQTFGLYRKLMSNDFDELKAKIGNQLTNAATQIDAKRKLGLVLDAENEFKIFKEQHRIADKFKLVRDRGWYFPDKIE